MSPLVLLGAAATLLSTVTLLPHLVHAVRTGQPGGSTAGWTLSFLASLAWFLYGIGIGDLVVSAPGVVTLPAGAVLAIWCFLARRRRTTGEATVRAVQDLATSRARLAGLDPTDTLELPRIA